MIDFGDVEVELCVPPELYERETVGHHFIAGKCRSMVETQLAEIGPRPITRIVDLGIYKGGSAVLYHKLFAPEKLIAIDWDAKRIPSLEAYAAPATGPKSRHRQRRQPGRYRNAGPALCRGDG